MASRDSLGLLIWAKGPGGTTHTLEIHQVQATPCEFGLRSAGQGMAVAYAVQGSAWKCVPVCGECVAVRARGEAVLGHSHYTAWLG